jgi:hypothetical protein
MLNPSFGSEEANQVYGPLTAEAVRQFKLGPPMILNQALRQTTPDNIVGKQTIKALDAALVNQKRKEIPDLPIPPIDPFGPFQVVIFDEPAPFLIWRQADNRQEDDLDIRRRDPDPANMEGPLPPASQRLLQGARLLDEANLQKAMLLELGGAGRGLGLDMANKFFKNQSVSEITFGPSDKLTQAVQAAPTFKGKLQNFESQISTVLQAGIKQRKVCDYHDLAEAKKTVAFSLPSFLFNRAEIQLKATIGGMKGGSVFLKNFDASQDTRRWKATLSFVLLDHFGINDDDLRPVGGHGTFGQICMWVLQHHHRPGNCPFISKFVFEVEASGTL